MAAIAGSIDTRILIATGDSEPTEIGTLTTELRALNDRTGVQLSAHQWRRDLTFAFLRMAWAVWRTRDGKPNPRRSL